jgi:CBS domain-containing protein
MTMQQNQYKEIWKAVQFHPLFQGVDERTALSLVEECEAFTYGKREMMLRTDTPRQGLLLILQGIADVFVKNAAGQEEVLEVIQKGEIVGFSSLTEFLGLTSTDKAQASVEVRAVDDVQALLIPFSVLGKRWDDQGVHDYLLAQVSVRLKDVYGSLAEQVKMAKGIGEGETILARVQDLMSEQIACVSPEASIKESAQKMFDLKTSSVLVVEQQELKGIITERDIVGRVVAKGISFEEPSRLVMTDNLVTISRFAYYYDALSEILLNGIKHLPVVDDGKISGVITLTDLLRKKNDSMMRTIKKIAEADEKSLPEIKAAIYEITETLLRDRVPAISLLDMVTKLYDRLIGRAVELSLKALREKGFEPPVPFAFYLMGSAGRGEQFMLTDQDHFLVYGETKEHDYFEKLGLEITARLEAAGYARCKGLMMSSEERWRGTVLHWQDRVRKWMLQSTNENLLLAQNFFSYRFVAGSEELDEQFQAKIAELLDRSKIFLYRMVQTEREQEIPTLDEPIRALFKLSRKSIDMKKEILFPFHHSLQVLSLYYGGITGTPLEKIASLREKGVFTEGFTEDLKEAFSHVLDLYIRQKWANNGGSSVLSFATMSTRQKDELILSLRTLRELQGMVFARFSV